MLLKESKKKNILKMELSDLSSLDLTDREDNLMT